MGLSSFLSNPILLAAAAVVAIGVVVYEIYQHKQHEKHGHRGRGSSSSPPRPPSPPPSPKRYKKDPIPKDYPSKKSSASDTSNELRKRFCAQTSPKTDCSKVESQEENSAAKNENCPERKQSFKADDTKVDNTYNENNYERNVFDKIVNDTKDIEKIVENRGSLVKNISDDEDSNSDSSENNLPSRNEEKLINTDAINEPGKSSSHSNNVQQTGLSDELLFIENPNLEENLGSLNSCLDSEEELLYKGKVVNSLKSDVDSKEKLYDESPGCSSASLECSVGAVSNDNSSKFFQLAEPTVCRGCEEKPVNTRIHPCNHRYLCLDCAHRVFRIYKKCIVCHSEIKIFVEI